MPLLEDTGFDIFSVADKKVIKRITPPNAEKEGFAEGLFIPEKNAFFVSQMTTANILKVINEEDKTVAFAVEKAIPQIEKLVDEITKRISNFRLMQLGGLSKR